MNVTERIGVSEIQRIIYRDFGWSFREQPIDDCGIDAYIEIADCNNASGKLIAVQIKSGQSYFHNIKNGLVTFYVDSRHQQYWSNMVLPVIVVLYNPGTEECIWESIEKIADKKLYIPLAQKLSAGFKKKLEELANLAPYVSAQRNRRIFLEGNRERFKEQFIRNVQNNDNKIELVIDFGSSRSMFGYIKEDGTISTFKTVNDKNYFDTVIGFDENYQLFFGEEALQRSYGKHIRIIRNFKRELGLNKKYQIFNMEFTAEDLTTLYMLAVIDDISRRYRVKPEECLIAMPINFSYEQRQAFRNCIEQCNLKIKRSLLESSCPGLFIEYMYQQEMERESEDNLILIVDIGGGTTDITSIENGDGVVEVLTSNGNKQLGGFDYDRVLQNLIYQKLLQKYPDILQDEYLRMQVELKSEELKMFFSEIDIVPLYLTNCYDRKKECRRNCFLTITKEEFCTVAEELNLKLDGLLDRTLEEAGIEDEMFSIYLGGAAGNICTVYELLKRKYPGHVIVADETEKAVFGGIAVQSGNFHGFSQHDKVLLMQAISCEIKVEGKAFMQLGDEEKELLSEIVIIWKDTLIPTKKERKITCVESQQLNFVVKTGDKESIICQYNVDETKDQELSLVCDIDANSALFLCIYKCNEEHRGECIMEAGPFYLI